MTSTRERATPVADATDKLSAREVLDLARSQQRAEDAAAARKLEAAALWADLHPPESIHAPASYLLAGTDHEEPIAGPGCPAVAQFCIAELGTVLGLSTTAAMRLIGHALELRHRLPRLLAAVQSGRVPAWRARLVAEATIHASPALTPASVRWIDRQITPYAAKVGPAQLDRLVAEANTPPTRSTPTTRTRRAPRPATSPSTPPRLPTPAPRRSPRSSTWPTPSTSTTRCAPEPPS